MITIMVISCARHHHLFHRATCLCLFLGSSKIGTNCTSTKTARVYHNGVSLCRTHHGHRKMLQHLRVPKRQREMIAAKIRHGVSRERVLDDIRQSVSSTFHRQHLVDRQDLANLQRACGMVTTIKVFCLGLESGRVQWATKAQHCFASFRERKRKASMFYRLTTFYWLCKPPFREKCSRNWPKTEFVATALMAQTVMTFR